MNKKLNLYVAGNGRPLILLHSLLSDRESFDRIMPALSANYRVVVSDLPGFGASPASTGLPETADRIAGLIDAFAPDGEVIVLGKGFGAFVALQTAIRHPALLLRLVLVGCGARFSDQGRSCRSGFAGAHAGKPYPGCASGFISVPWAWPSSSWRSPSSSASCCSSAIRSNAVAVVLAGFLAFAGLGSAVAARWTAAVGRGSAVRGIAFAVVMVAFLAATYLLALPFIFEGLLALPDAAKIAISVLLIAPLAVFMGYAIPPRPWLCRRTLAVVYSLGVGINGCASVLSAILAALLAMHVGFTGVVTIATVLYLVAPALLAGSWDRYDQQTSQGFVPDRKHPRFKPTA